MRRFLSVAAMAAVSIGLLVPAADAATTPITSTKGLPSDWHGVTFPCGPTGSVANYAPARVTGPATPPAGQGSAKVTGTASAAPIMVFGPQDEPLLSTLTAFDAYVYVPSTGGATPRFEIDAADGSVDYFLHLDSSGTNAWTHYDTTGATVLTYDSFDNTTNTEVDDITTTLSDFVTNHPNALFEGFAVGPKLCGAGTFYLDDVHYAVGTTDNTVNFEAPTPTALANGSHPTSVLTGTAVTLGAHLTSSGTPLEGQSVSLYLHGVGKPWTLVKRLTTDSNGAVSMKVAPSSTTTYQWRYEGIGTDYATANAAAYTIVSRQRVAVSSKPTSVAYRGTATIKGRITPNKAGVTVRLIRIVSGKRIVVASARTTTGGYYTIKAPMTVRGTASYLVSALPYTGEDLGQSATFKIVTK